MGLIKNIVGAIFGIISGIVKSVLGIFGIGKKSEYYLEADEADSSSALQEKPQAATKQEQPTPAQENASAPAQATKTEAPAAEAKPAPAPKPVPVQPKPEPIGSFATNYLNAPSSSKGRRRPGPSLSPFKEMAKQVKVPAKAR
jgi:hypothetical protein